MTRNFVHDGKRGDSMKIRKICAAYFSATGTTKKKTTGIAEGIAGRLGVECERFDFTLPEARSTVRCFDPDTLVVFGTPVYAGRVPNVLLKYLATVQGGKALAVPVVVYGNRHFDDALIELRDILEKDGFHTLAAGAFIGEHSFSVTLAAGRPDAADMAIVDSFAGRVSERVAAGFDVSTLTPVEVEGTPYPYRGYYQPRDRKGAPVDIRKVKSLVNENCNDCKICAKVCPMGSISMENVREYTGICIKCGACIKKCPQHARYYDDAGYLYHQHELEEGLVRRAEPSLFV